MRTILILLITLSASFLFAQSKQFKSSTTSFYRPTKTKEVIQRDVTISKDLITITDLWNGGTEDAKFKVERTEQKNYNLEPSTWYYCIDTREEISTEDSDKRVYRKTIVVVPDSVDGPFGFIHVFHFADEITIFHYVLSLD